MNDNDQQILTPIGPLTQLFIRLAGGDVDTARRCPPRDLEVFRILALVMLGTAAYQTAVLGLIGHLIFAQDGAIHPMIVAVAGLIALFIMLIDSFAFMRAGWLSAGEADLARAGLDLGSNWSATLKKGLSLAVRLVLAIGLAELLALFMAMAIFGADVRARIDDRFLKANAPLLGTVRALVDGEIKRGESDVAALAVRVAALASDVGSLRDSAGGVAANSQVRAAQAEVDRYIAAKAKADDDVRAAEALAAGELSGAKGAGYSGQPGRGPRRRAAEETLNAAKARAASAAGDLQAARARLEDRRKEAVASSESLQTRALTELPRLEALLAAEDTKLAAARTRLADLVDGRGRAIRHGIESTPEHVPYDGGLIAQIKTLEQIVDGDRKLQALLLLIGLVGFGFELAGVLAKLMTHTPTTYAALTVRDNYLQAMRIVDEMAAELDQRTSIRTAAATSPSAEGSVPAGAPSNDNDDALLKELMGDGGAQTNVSTTEKPKRPRGRPRKVTLN